MPESVGRGAVSRYLTSTNIMDCQHDYELSQLVLGDGRSQNCLGKVAGARSAVSVRPCLRKPSTIEVAFECLRRRKGRPLKETLRDCFSCRRSTKLLES